MPVNIGGFAFSRLLWLTVICFKNGKPYPMSVSNLRRAKAVLPAETENALISV
jgi:hypothetical protein